jgi:hypothetical protein
MVSLKDLAETWSALYTTSPALKSTLAFLHIGGLVAGGGAAIAADRTTLRAMRKGQAALDHELAHLHHVHLFVIGGLAVVIASGLLLMFADLDSYLVARVFWIKMGLVVLLLANGALVMRGGRRTHAGDPSGPAVLKFAAIASLTLWFGTTLLGAILPNAL